MSSNAWLYWYWGKEGKIEEDILAENSSLSQVITPVELKRARSKGSSCGGGCKLSKVLRGSG